jgi:hypothetical protein
VASVWDDAPIVEVLLPPKPTCPCGSAQYIPIRGTTDADGGRTSRRVCKHCGERYVVLTLPRLGRDDEDDL